MSSGLLNRGGALLVFTVFAALTAGPFGCEPKPPEAPSEPPPGNCCMRAAEPAASRCGEQKGCCRSGLDRDECEEKKGVWFHTTEGCLGAC